MKFPSSYNLFLSYQIQYCMCISVSSLSINPKYFEIYVQMCICSDRRDGHGEMGWHRAGDGSEIFCVITVPPPPPPYLNDVIIWGSKSVCFCGKVRFCLLVHNKHWSRYLIKAQLYFYHVITKQKYCFNHNNVNSCELS